MYFTSKSNLFLNKLYFKHCWFFCRSFVLNGEVYFVGDFAFCKYKPAGKSNIRICRLMTLYHSNEAWHSNAREKAVVRWYTFARDLESKYNIMRIKFDLENEVIEDYRGIDVFISLENLIKKCRVVFATEEDPIDLIRKEQLNKDLYFSCRYKIIHDHIEPIFSPDSQWGEKEVFTTLAVHSSPIASITDLKSPLKRKSLSSNSDNGSTTKTPKLSSKMNLLNITSSEQKKSVRRNLNDSFADVLSPEYGTPTLNYSVVSPSSQSKDSMKIKLRLSQKRNPQVILENLKDEILEAYIKPNKETTNNDPSPTTLRRSSRDVQRKSYAELITPEKFNRDLHARNDITESRTRIKRNILHSPKQYTSETINSPTKMSSVGKRVTKTPKKYTDTTAPSTRRSILKTTTDCSTPTKRVTLSEDCVPETPKRRRSTVSTPKSVSKSTPGSRLKQIKEGVVTPSMEKRGLGVQKGDTPLGKARSQLHVSHVPEALPCREKEFSDVLGFLEAKLEDGCGG